MGNVKNKPSIYKIWDFEKVFFWRMTKKRMTSFRTSVYLDEKIKPKELRKAVNNTIKRFPFFSVKTRKNFFDYYFIDEDKDIEIIKEDKSGLNNIKPFNIEGPYLRITYYDNCISLEMCHALTDGGGALDFIKVLTVEYLKLCGNKITIDDSIIDINSPIKLEEYDSYFDKVPYRKGTFRLKDKTSSKLDGKLYRNNMGLTTSISMNIEDIKRISKKYGCTINEYFVALMFIASKKFVSKKHGDVNILVPVSLRKHFGVHSLKNLVAFPSMRLKLNEINDVKTTIEILKPQSVRNKSSEYFEEIISSLNVAMKRMKFIPLILKKPITRLAYVLYGDKMYTCMLSNFGNINLPKEVSKHVTRIDPISYSERRPDPCCSIVTYKDTLYFYINRRINSTSFEKEIERLLNSDGINNKIQEL